MVEASEFQTSGRRVGSDLVGRDIRRGKRSNCKFSAQQNLEVNFLNFVSPLYLFYIHADFVCLMGCTGRKKSHACPTRAAF
jgi:hypothetical protein